MLERAISRESWGEPATEEDRVKAQGNKVNHLGQEEGSLESLEESIGLCAIPSPVGAVRQTPRGAARPQAAFSVGRCGYVWKHHPCQVEVEVLKRGRERMGTAPNSQEKGPALFAPLFFPLLSGNLSSLAPAWAS